MFEYAYLIALMERGYKVGLNLSLYNVKKQHNGWELSDVFKVKKPVQRFRRLSKWLVRLLCHYPENLFLRTERSVMEYNPIWIKPSKAFLKGVWINPRYFESVEHIIRDVYRFRNIDDRNLMLATTLRTSESVSIHIRRGDYLNLPNYCVCDEAFYVTAMDMIKKMVENPVFYIFSNDPEWCNAFMEKQKVDYKIIDHNIGADSYKDMFLMTQCHHNIIANSTFSWWGAWLNQSPGKIVIAPKYWFKDNQCSPNLTEWVTI